MLKKFKIQLKIKHCELVFKEGLEKGVLGELELEYDLKEEDFKKALFIKTLYDEANKLKEELIQFTFEEIK